MENIEEIWKPVKDFEGYYEVSNLGRVRSVEREIMRLGKSFLKKSKQLTLTINPKGYVQLKLYKGKNKPKSSTVHKIVALAFISNNKNLKEINHKDGIKTNNNVSNLEWCTRGENVLHTYKMGLRGPETYKGEGNCTSKLTENIVREIRTEYPKNRYSYSFLAKKYNTCVSNISAIITRKTWNHI